MSFDVRKWSQQYTTTGKENEGYSQFITPFYSPMTTFQTPTSPLSKRNPNIPHKSIISQQNSPKQPSPEDSSPNKKRPKYDSDIESLFKESESLKSRMISLKEGISQWIDSMSNSLRNLGCDPSSVLESVKQHASQEPVRIEEKASPLDSYVSQEISTYVDPLVTQSNSFQPKIRSPTKKKQDVTNNESDTNAPMLNPQKLKQRYIINEKRLSIFPFKTTILSESHEEFVDFLKMWESQQTWAWCLFFTVPPEFAAKVTTEEESVTWNISLCEVQGISICFSPVHVYYVPLFSQDFSRIDARWEAVKNMMANVKYKKILYSMKPQIKILFGHGIIPSGTLYDPKICCWLRSPDDNKDKTLYQLTEEYTNESSPMTGTLFEENVMRVNRSYILMTKMFQIIEHDIEYAKSRGDSTNFPSLLQMEMLIVPILAHMEYQGIGFTPEICDRDRDCIEKTIAALESKAHKLAGREFSLTSTSEVADMLFEELKLPLVGQKEANIKRTRRQQYSTSQIILSKLSTYHALPQVILQHRKLTHLLHHYVDLLYRYASYDKRMHMRRICTTILQTATPTGRLACVDPNVMAITHKITFIPAEEMNKPNPKEATISVRDSFVATIGHVLLGADYSQMELRLVAHLSKDPILTEFLRGGGDVFKQIASHWLGKDAEKVTNDERQQAKHLCYGALYGAGPSGMAEKTKMTKEEAEELISSFKQKYSKLTDFLNKIIQDCRLKGYIYTILGRKRFLPEINSSVPKLRRRAERQAVNSVCQGSAADIAKMAMIKIYQSINSNGYRAALVLQLHDELLFEVKEDHVPAVKEIVKRCMENTMPLSVPLPVKISIGKSWGSLKEEL